MESNALHQEGQGHDDGCYYLDGMTAEELESRMSQAAEMIRREAEVLQGCMVRLGI